MDLLLDALEAMPLQDTEMSWGTLGTIRPFPNFRPERDARQIAVAMANKGYLWIQESLSSGGATPARTADRCAAGAELPVTATAYPAVVIGTDVSSLVRVLTNRTNAQRQQIAEMYRGVTGQELVPNLKRALSGEVETMLLGLMMTPAVFDAHQLRNAMEGLGTDEEVLVEVLSTRSAAQLQQIAAAYRDEFQRDLEKDIRSETSQGFRELLLALLQVGTAPPVRLTARFRMGASLENPVGIASPGMTARNTQRNLLLRDTAKEEENMKGIIDYRLIERDAKALLERSRKKPDTAAWIRVLTRRDSDHLCRDSDGLFRRDGNPLLSVPTPVLDRFQALSGRPAEEAVQSDFSGDLRQGLLSLVQSIRSTPELLAGSLHKAMKGLGRKDGVLIRILVSRSEVDLLSIRVQYRRQQGRSLYSTLQVSSTLCAALSHSPACLSSLPLSLITLFSSQILPLSLISLSPPLRSCPCPSSLSPPLRSCPCPSSLSPPLRSCPRPSSLSPPLRSCPRPSSLPPPLRSCPFPISVLKFGLPSVTPALLTLERLQLWSRRGLCSKHSSH
ncbi:ANXA2 protein, partial [Atractosteus spatula]|nr:ANXA2 protein [Atractosteus spatula]